MKTSILLHTEGLVKTRVPITALYHLKSIPIFLQDNPESVEYDSESTTETVCFEKIFSIMTQDFLNLILDKKKPTFYSSIDNTLHF